MQYFDNNTTSWEESPGHHGQPVYKIALVGNLKEAFQKKIDEPPDAGSEFDKRDTIEAIASALESRGHKVIFCEADRNLPGALQKIQPDIVFNIAEGRSGDGREAHVPALCELLEIPYTGSRVVANAISLDKTQTKRIWREVGLPTAPFREFSSPDGITHTALRFPMFVKPAHEGTGMGINEMAIVRNYSQLQERVEWTIKNYKQPALIEEYLPGREFTVGFIGNPADLPGSGKQGLYGGDGYHFFPVLEIETRDSITPGIYGGDAKGFSLDEPGAPAYLCPADIDPELEEMLCSLTKQAAQSLQVCDFSRVDFRLGANGQPYLLEINTLPGLNPEVSDLCIMASAEGMHYDDLINEILNLAIIRYELVHQAV